MLEIQITCRRQSTNCKKPKPRKGYTIESYYCECGCKNSYWRYVTKKPKLSSIQEIAQHILTQENLQDWKIDWWTSPPSICDTQQKTIWISESYQHQPLAYQYEILLHEIAHIQEKQHNAKFYQRFAALLAKYAELMNTKKQ